MTAQTLAHRGWAGSGIEVAPWWSSAVFYEIDPLAFQDSDGDGFGDLAGIVDRLDYLKSLGVDAVLLSPYQIVPGTPQAAQQEEEFAHLVSEAGRRQMRVLVDLPLDGAMAGATPPSLEMTLATGRFWLSRGAAGLRATRRTATEEKNPAVSALRQLAGSFNGERVLLVPAGLRAGSDEVPAVAFYRAGHRRSHHAEGAGQAGTAGAQLRVLPLEQALPALTPGGVRALLAQSAGGVALSSDSTDRERSWDRYGDRQHDAALAKLIATVLFTSRAAPLLLYGQELGMATTPAPAGADGNPGNPLPMAWGGAKGFTAGTAWVDASRNAATANVATEDADPASVLTWYRRLSVLEHANPALRGGSVTVLATPNPEVAAWLRQAPRGGVLAPPVVVLCNFSGREQVVALAHALAAVHVAVGAAARLRVLADSTQSSPANGAALAPTIAGVVLPAYGVAIAEIAPRPGLEDAPAPYVRSRRRGR